MARVVFITDPRFPFARTLEVARAAAHALPRGELVVQLRDKEASVRAGVKKVVFASSGGTIYGVPDEIPTRESAPQVPESPYGIAK